MTAGAKYQGLSAFSPKNFSDRAFRQRFALMMTGIFGMGIFLSFIIKVDYGTDPSSFLMLGISEVSGISFGTVMLTVNLILFIPELLFGRHLIGWGTVCNMTMIGYIADFCRYLETSYLPPEMFEVQPFRTITFIAALIPFLISVAIYMNADCGQVPYDAAPTMIHEYSRIPYTIVRICWDFSVIGVGLACGRALTVTTVVMALFIGPTCSLIGRWLKRPKK